jgi:flagellum-specific ATP synthase
LTPLAALAARVRADAVDAQPDVGQVIGARGPAVRVSLPHARVGARLRAYAAGPDGRDAVLEIVGFDGLDAVALPLTPLRLLSSGQPVVLEAAEPVAPCGEAVLGRVLNALGEPVDGGPPLPADEPSRPLWGEAPDPLTRRPVDRPLPLGVRALDAFTTLGAGQRVALEAGPGAGKTTLLAQIAARAAAQVVVLALVGERGREVSAYLSQLAPARHRTVVVLARADEPPLAALRAAECATAIAEGFRSRGADVLLLVDSLTRVARAIRAVGLAAGEPPTRRGYPPSLSTVLPRLLERAGNDAAGTLTALYAVLVEGDDRDDPVAEEARGLLDGHLCLDPALASAGRFPAVAIERSLSRCMAQLARPEHARAAATLRGWLAAGARRADLVAIGAYQRGAEPDVDRYLAVREPLERLLRQGPDEAAPFDDTVARLIALAGGRADPAPLR